MTSEWEGLRLSDILRMGQRALEEERLAAEAEAARREQEARARYDAAWAAACAPVYEAFAQLRPWIVQPRPFELENSVGCLPRHDEVIRVRIPGFSMIMFKVSGLGSVYRFTDYSSFHGSPVNMDYPAILVYKVDEESGGAEEFTLKFFHKALATARRFYLEAHPEESGKELF